MVEAGTAWKIPAAWRLYFIGVALLMFVAQAFAPISIFANANFDDGLYMSLAQRFASGSWFGHYNLFSIHKGNGYPMFLAVASWLDVPVTLAHALFHVAACLTFALVVGRLAGSVRLAAAVFAALAIVPALGSTALLRVFRDAIYSGQTLFVLAAVLWTICRAQAPGRIRRGILTGLLLGWYWLTREEGVWILPALLVIVLLAPLTRAAGAGTLRSRALAAGLALLWLAAGFIAFEGGYRLINRAVYGTWTSVAMKDPAYERALGALYSVEDGKRVPYVPVSASARARIYEVSPAFAALKPYLDPEDRVIWTYGCGHYPESCGEIAGGWFHVAFLQAVADIGAHKTNSDATAVYNRIAQEVTAACADGRLQCRPTLHNAIPRLAPDFMATLGPRISRILQHALLMVPQSPLASPSTGTRSQIADALAVVNRPLHVPSAEFSQQVVIELQYEGTDPGALTVQMLDGTGAVLDAQIEEVTHPPVEKNQRRLKISLSCALPACVLDAKQGERGLARIALWDLTVLSSRFKTDQGALKIHWVRADGLNIVGDVRQRASFAIRTAAMRLSPVLIPALAGIGVIAWLVGCALAIMGRTLPLGLVISTAMGASIVARVAIFVIGDAAGLPVNPPYLSPITFLLAAAAPLAVHGAWAAHTARRLRRAAVSR